MVLELYSDDVYHEDDFTVPQQSVLAMIFIILDHQFVSIVKELFNERVEAKFLELPRHDLFGNYCLLAKFAMTVY